MKNKKMPGHRFDLQIFADDKPTVSPIPGPGLPAPYKLMVHNSVMDSMAFFDNRNKDYDPVSGSFTIFNLAYDAIIETTKHTPVGLLADKLLCSAIAEYTATNYTGTDAVIPKILTVSLPEVETYRKFGYAIPTDDAGNPSASTLKERRKELKNALDVLHTGVRFQGKNGEHVVASFVGSHSIRNGRITICLDVGFVASLLQKGNPLLTYFPECLLSISGRYANAYRVGRKIALHSFMDSNRIRGTHNKLKVQTLLDCTDLPTYEEVSQSNRAWKSRIYDPMDRILNHLHRTVSLIKDWDYCRAGGEAITEEERYSGYFDSYENWASAYVVYELNEAPDLTERIEYKKALLKKEQQQKKRKSKAKSKPSKPVNEA